jgi:hypothetical protein
MEIPGKLLESTINRGTIVHSNAFEGIGHGKFFVIMGVKEDRIAGFFFINSNIHPAIYKNQELLDMQYPTKRTDYPFLRYDSFLCATQIMTVGKAELAGDIENETAKIMGMMKSEHLSELLEAARNSVLFSKEEKRDFFSE